MKIPAFLILAFALAPAFAADDGEGGGDAAVDGGTVLVELHGSLPLRPEFSLMAGGGIEPSLHEACELLRKAIRAEEPHIAIDCTGGFLPGPAAAEELAAVLARRGDERVHLLIDFTDDAAQILARECDEVAVNEAGMLMVDGLAIEVDHYKAAFAKIGLAFHAVTSGPEKTAPEPFVAEEPSEAARAEYRHLLAAMDAVLVAGGTGEGFDEAALRAARAEAPQDGARAAELGLADEAVEPGAWRAALPGPVRRLGGGEEMPDISTFAGAMAFWGKLLQGERRVERPRVVAVVELEGTIMDGSGGSPGSVITGTDTAAMIDDLADDERIKAVVVRINSPGGSASASDRIYHALRRLDEVKPVVALCEGVAASGGYYIAAGAREIMVHRATVTGSIGVFALMPDLRGTWDELGITTFRLESDPRAGILRPFGFGEEKAAALRAMVEATDARFRAVVAGARGLDAAEVAGLADGKVFLGERAVELGLADGVGALADAVARARALGGEEEPLPLELYPREEGLAGMLRGLGLSQVLRELGLPQGLAGAARSALSGRPLIWAWGPASRWR